MPLLQALSPGVGVGWGGALPSACPTSGGQGLVGGAFPAHFSQIDTLCLFLPP